MQLEDIISNRYVVYAHMHPGKEKETLKQHTDRCEKYFHRLLKEKRIQKVFLRFLKAYLPDASKNAWKLAWEIFKGAIPFHDTGKINPAFQKNKMGQKDFPFQDILCLSGANHSFFSAWIYLDYYYGNIERRHLTKAEKRKLKALAYSGAYVISRHHSNLGDMEDFRREFDAGGSACLLMEYFVSEEFSLYQGPFFFHADTIQLVMNADKAVTALPRTVQIYYYAIMRLWYSVLTCADYYATTEYMLGHEMEKLPVEHSFAEAYEESALVKQIRAYEKDGYGRTDTALCREINTLRNEMFLDVEKSWEENSEEALFFLEAPTGSGKSNVAMNLSFQMQRRKKGKIFYVYPFNTLVEQNLASLKRIFEKQEDVFSKIAVINSVTPIKMDASRQGEEEECDCCYYQKALLDRQFLNYPFILTTHVSLFEVLFGNSRESLFGFHQLIDGIVVLDEIQAYRNEIWSEIIIFLDALADLLGMKVIIMSATLPDLSYLAEEAKSVVRLMPDHKKYFGHPVFCKRVRISYKLLEGAEVSAGLWEERVFADSREDRVFAGSWEERVFDGCGERAVMERLGELHQHLVTYTDRSKAVLMEFIYKKTAYQFYGLLCADASEGMEGRHVYLLTGDDNIVERARVLNEIKENREGAVLVSTQIVEAGVDIDMDIGYKDISKLDSEEQFLGRINRSCIRSGMVYFFDLDSAERIYKKDIRKNPEFTLKQHSMRDILDSKRFGDYYNAIMKVLKEQRNESSDENGLEYFFEEIVARGKFDAVAERMRLIDENDWNIPVYLSRDIALENGEVLDGWECWNQYRELLENQQMDFAKKRILLSQVRQKMSYFIYETKRSSNLVYTDRIGELYAIQDGEKYFLNGKLNRAMLEGEGGVFIDI